MSGVHQAPTETVDAAAGDLERGLDRLRTFIRQNCVITSAQEPLTDSRGRPQAWVFDLRPALLQGWAAQLIARCFWARMAQHWPFQVAGVELAALPLLGAILAHGSELGYPVTGLAVRRERKTYGRSRAIEGELSGLPIILIDDMINSGRTLVKSSVTLEALGGRIAHVFTVIDFESPIGADKLRALDLSVVRLFALGEFGLQLPRPSAAPKPTPPLQVRWCFQPDERRYGFVARKAAPVVAGDRVLHSTEDGWLHAVIIETGEICWELQAARRSRKGIWSTPAIAGGHAFLGSYDGAVLKVALGDGAVAWRFEGAEWIGSSPAIEPDGEALYIGVEWGNGRGEGGVVRLDAATGRLDWEVPVPAQVHASPVILAGGDIACGANDGHVRRISRDGDVRWSADVGGDVKGAIAVAADGGALFVASFDGSVVALDAGSGERLWRSPTDGPLFATPLLRDGLLACASTDGGLHLLDATDGREQARFSVGGKLFAAPVAIDDDVVIGAATGRLVRLSWPDLAVVSEHQFPERIVSEIAIEPRTMLVPTFDGQLYAIERKPAAEAA